MTFRRYHLFKTLFFVLTLFSLSEIVFAQNQPQADENKSASTRPKIGLVLSGGGARGFAHIGALKVLEANNIPIDYIVGTSMGSIVGGLYAIGLSPVEIEQGVASIAWDKVFTDFAIRDYRTYRHKRDDFDFFNIHRIGINNEGIQLSPGLIEGQQIEIALDRLAYPGFHINDYDKLRIPYRAIATNLENGESIVIAEGNIARAMRASMSIPGVLPPITINGTLLVDGGIANNIPIDTVREMGADIVIVVDVSAPLDQKDKLKSSVDVTGQLTTILTRRIADIQLNSLNKTDVLIVPGQNDISSSDFIRYPELIEAGYDAASKQQGKLQKISLADNAYAQYKASLPDVARRNPVIDFVEIKNNTKLKDEVMDIRIHQKTGEVLNIAQLEEDLSYIYGLDHSSSVVYSIETRDDKTGLIIYIRDRDWAHSHLQFGLSIKTEADIGSFTNINAAYVKSDLNSLAGEFRATAGLGSEPSLRAEVYQPLNVALDTFVSAEIGSETTIFPIVESNTIDSILRFQRRYIDLSAGKIFKQTSQVKLGIRHNNGRTVAISGTPPNSDGDFQEGYYYAGLFHDSLDNLSFPNTGFFGGLSISANRDELGADSEFEQVQMILSGAGTYKRYTIFSRAILEATIDENAPFNALHRHGGFLELSGTLDRELAGQHFGLIESAFYRRLGNITFLPIYSGFSLEAGNVWDRYDDISSDNTILAGSIFIGAETFIGPVYLSIGATDKGDTALYFNLGQTFIYD